jgi:pimeloyl-ACP methyl ester carboxylesterase
MFIQIGNLHMFVEDRSASDFETILFIHGFPFDHSMWRHQLYLLGTEFRCVAPDLRGHGGTRETGAPSTPEEFTIDLLADDLIALLDQIHPRDKKLTVCGLSIGGYIAFALWRKIPDRIRQLILADTKATPDTPDARARRQAQADKVKANGPAAISDGMLDTLLTPENRNSVIGMDVRRMIESTSSQGIVNTLHALANRPDSTDTLATITVPTLVVVGEQDKLTPVSDAQYIHERLHHAAPLAVIPHAGHVSPLENPDEFNRFLLDFLRAKP